MPNHSNYEQLGINYFKRHQEIYGNGRDSLSFQSKYMSRCCSLYSYKLYSHFGCVNAVEFSNKNQELLASGGDDKRVLLWNIGQALHQNKYKPEMMIGTHLSNIFCISFSAGNNQILSSGNDDQVLVHDIHTKQLVHVYWREDAVYSISSHPFDPFIFITASEDGELHLTDTRDPDSSSVCLASYTYAFHGVAFNPLEPLFVAAANSREGASLWDIRKPERSILCYGAPLSQESTMSVQFNAEGSHLLVLRRKKYPRVYKTHSNIPFVEGTSKMYFNSCTMKSGCFAGAKDEYFVSGSDDFKIYVWKIPDLSSEDLCVKVKTPQLILRGHRSIVNQVRYNRQSHALVSAGVEKYLNLWSPFHYPNFKGQIERPSTEATRRPFTREQWIDMFSDDVITHDYESQNTDEDLRMIAFFDGLLEHDQNVSDSDSDNSVGVVGNINFLAPDIDDLRPDEEEASSSSVFSSDIGLVNDQSLTSFSRENVQSIPNIPSIQSDDRLQKLRHSLRASEYNDNEIFGTSSNALSEAEETTKELLKLEHTKTLVKHTGSCNSSVSRECTLKRNHSSSSDDSDAERRSIMRKRNAFRWKKKSSVKSNNQDGNTATSSAQNVCGDCSSTTGRSSENAYERSRQKLERSIEKTNKKLSSLADRMASAIEKAYSNSDESDDSDVSFNNNNSTLIKKDLNL